jgi:hypothetical protein
MRKTATFGAAIATATIATGFGMRAASPTNARVPSIGAGVEPFQLMMNGY